MSFKNTLQMYGSVAKLFHWMIFLLIVGLLTVGFIMADMEPSPDKFKLYGLHKSIGITVLLLACLRLLWKTVNVSPILPDSLKQWQKFVARAGHLFLYLLMIAMPLSGWAMSSAAGLPVSVFGWFVLPNLVEPSKALLGVLRETHTIIAYVIIVTVSLHATAALLHHFYYKDNVLRRMLPFVKGE